MEKRLQHLHEDTFTLYTKLAQTLKWAQSSVREHATDAEYCVDVAFAMNELDKLLKDIGVEIRKTRELAESIACMVWMRSDSDEPIRTEHCSASPRVKLQPAMPKRGSKEMGELLTWLGLRNNHDVVRIHWPTLCDLVSDRAAESKPMPPWLVSGEMHNPSAVLTFHKKKDVTE